MSRELYFPMTVFRIASGCFGILLTAPPNGCQNLFGAEDFVLEALKGKGEG